VGPTAADKTAEVESAPIIGLSDIWSGFHRQIGRAGDPGKANYCDRGQKELSDHFTPRLESRLAPGPLILSRWSAPDCIRAATWGGFRALVNSSIPL
jgi:hypothetical protein